RRPRRLPGMDVRHHVGLRGQEVAVRQERGPAHISLLPDLDLRDTARERRGLALADTAAELRALARILECPRRRTTQAGDAAGADGAPVEDPTGRGAQLY